MIESVAVDQDADRIVALMQEQQVGFRVRDGVEAMISAVRRFLKNDTNRALMQGDISSAYGSINRLAVRKAVRRHIPCLAPLGASQFVTDGAVAAIQERVGSGKKIELHCSVAKRVATRKHAEQRNLLLDILEQDAGNAGPSELRAICNGLHLVR